MREKNKVPLLPDYPVPDDQPPNRLLWVIAIIALCIIAYLVFAANTEAQAPSPVQHWMVIRHGYLGYDFDCVSEYPYADIRPMAWNPTDGFTEVSDNFDFVESIIAVEACNIDHIYQTDDGSLFTWRMTDIEREGSRYAIHVNRGAFWIAPR
jgi:hypothetical protein